MPFVTDIIQYWVGILAHRAFEYLFVVSYVLHSDGFPSLCGRDPFFTSFTFGVTISSFN
ncbi:Uncharacterised protein [Bacteroides thetaiotaomicron]|nr:Uncharacterised protein [Bacteroides thetaiotaomicron]